MKKERTFSLSFIESFSKLKSKYSGDIVFIPIDRSYVAFNGDADMLTGFSGLTMNTSVLENGAYMFYVEFPRRDIGKYLDIVVRNGSSVVVCEEIKHDSH